MSNQLQDVSVLDEIRIKDGIKQCKTFFEELLKTDKEKAVRLLNDRRTTFPCVFVSLPQIKPQGRYYYLSSRNKTAWNIIREILSRQDTAGSNLLAMKNGNVQNVLKWMIETGYAEDGCNNEYDQVMDTAVSVLINLYEDTSILPIVAELIFRRNRSDHLYHDLVWAFFRYHNPYTLQLIADRMRSAEKKDVSLACELLNIELSDNSIGNADSLYQNYLNWLAKNDPFLYFTGESFQYSSRPAVCSVDLERKYLGQGTNGYDRTPVTPSDDFESECLEVFKPLGRKEKEELSEYSYQYQNQDRAGWQEWIRRSIDEQLKSVKTTGEGSV